MNTSIFLRWAYRILIEVFWISALLKAASESWSAIGEDLTIIITQNQTWLSKNYLAVFVHVDCIDLSF